MCGLTVVIVSEAKRASGQRPVQPEFDMVGEPPRTAFMATRECVVSEVAPARVTT
jgi:hypothetical protein